MEFMKFDPTKQPHLFFYNKIIATICGKDGYFLLETYPPLIHNRVILHARDKDAVMLEVTQYLYDVARQTVDIFISLKHEYIHDSFIQMYSENWQVIK